MKKVLLLGGAGFIGFSIAKYLAEKGGYKITIADNFFRAGGKIDSSLQSLVDEHDIRIVSGDFTESDCFLELEKDYHYVYMLASVVGVDYVNEMPHEIIRINTALIYNTLEWLRASNCGKIVFTSTSECYAGTVEAFDYQIPTAEEVPLTIQDITHPRFTYAVTKMLGESGFIQYSNKLGFECTIVRYHNVYGQRMGFKHVIPGTLFKRPTIKSRRSKNFERIISAPPWSPVSASTPAHCVMCDAHDSVLVTHFVNIGDRTLLAAKPNRQPVIAQVLEQPSPTIVRSVMLGKLAMELKVSSKQSCE